MVESNGRFDLGPARTLWRDALLNYDPEIAVKALGKLSKTTKRIDLSDLCEMIVAMTPRQPQAEENPQKLSTEVPEWCWVWFWARLHREPPELRSLPQQDSGDPEALTQKQYMKLQREWVAAGSPKEIKWVQAASDIAVERPRDAADAIAETAR
jgi:hypothetical protein